MRSMSIDDSHLYSFSINSKRYSLAYIHSTGHRERGYQQIIVYLAIIIFILWLKFEIDRLYNVI